MQNKTLDQLVVWAATLEANPLTQKLVSLEFQRRVADAQIKSAKATKVSAERAMLSIIAAVAVAVVGWIIDRS